jgi:hypothetical protein
MAKPKGAISRDRIVEAETLREVLKPVYEKLREKGVSEFDLPSSEDLVKRLSHFIDYNKIDEWGDKYADWVAKKP